MIDAVAASPPTTTCAACGSSRLWWRVKRLRAPAGHASQRSLAWLCQECGAGWEEPLSQANVPYPALGPRGAEG